MTHSNRTPRKAKRSKPHRDFPLFKHQTGRWCKKIHGKHHYFGPVTPDGDHGAQAALGRWLDQKDDLLAGRELATKGEGTTVANLVNHYLTHKQALVTSGELAERTFQRYHANCALVVGTLGRNRLVADLRPDDFQGLRSRMTGQWGAVAVANEIQMTRSLFRYGYEAGLLQAPVRFGPGFKKPSAKTLRQVRAAAGPRLFAPEQVRSILEHATINMRAAVLLACNGALGNTDLALLPIAAIDWQTGFLNYARAKTAIARRIPLWPETLDAIRNLLADRREPKDPADAGLLLIGPRGESYVGKHRGYRVTQEFGRIVEKAGIDGRTFYDLRRTFQTIGEETGDLVAVQSIMGHAPASGDMSSVYRQRVTDERLQRVTNHVRQWLFGMEKKE